MSFSIDGRNHNNPLLEEILRAVYPNHNGVYTEAEVVPVFDGNGDQLICDNDRIGQTYAAIANSAIGIRATAYNSSIDYLIRHGIGGAPRDPENVKFAAARLAIDTFPDIDGVKQLRFRKFAESDFTGGILYEIVFFDSKGDTYRILWDAPDQIRVAQKVIYATAANHYNPDHNGEAYFVDIPLPPADKIKMRLAFLALYHREQGDLSLALYPSPPPVPEKEPPADEPIVASMSEIPPDDPLTCSADPLMTPATPEATAAPSPTATTALTQASDPDNETLPQ